MPGVRGLHHVTAIASDAQRNVNFYAGVLGLRLVKRSVNFDDPQTHHLYYGDAVGSPGSLVTFFVWPGAHGGQRGAGQAAVVSFSVLPGAIGFWIERLLRHGIAYEGPTKTALGERVLRFQDADGTLLQIAGDAAAEARHPWTTAGVAPEHAIRGVHGVTLWIEETGATERLLEEYMGFRAVAEADGIRRFSTGGGAPGTLVDVRAVGGFLQGSEGPGSVHHVAWDVGDDASQDALRERLVRSALDPTPVIDRKYFKSVYFREPGGVLFEAATDAPGFLVDEPADKLGERLMLPADYEPLRDQLEAALPRIELPGAFAR